MSGSEPQSSSPLKPRVNDRLQRFRPRLLAAAANSLAMYELTSFRVIRLIRGTETLEERIAKRPLTFKGIGRPKGGPRLAVGRTYTVRLVPSDETWKQIERGEEVVSLDCQEIEIVPDED